ncbi:MAG: (Fe-S)-binding protein [Firmicutes bacterium]|nr:(Fe-S)-binding protein [Bacillota bacterium]
MALSGEALAVEIMKCVRCGQCRAVCPVFLESGAETDVARGRIFLVKLLMEGRLDGKDLDGALSRCLGCKSCFQECPSGVKGDQIVLAGRAEMVLRHGLGWMKRGLYRGVLGRPKVFGAMVGLGSLAQRVALARVPRDSGIRLRLPGNRVPRTIPWLPRRPLRPKGTATYSPGGELDQETRSALTQGARMGPGAEGKTAPRRRVLYFTGCLTNYLYPRIGRAVIDVLNRNGVEVIVPADQTCCGLPARGAGDLETADRLMAANLEAMSRYEADAIIVSCATCLTSWKEDYPAAGGTLGERARDMAAKVYDFSQYLTEVLEFQPPEGALAMRVTYHDPCHHFKGMQIKKEPRKLLKAVPGLEFKEMAEAERCCGFAGSFSVWNYDLAVKINDRKIKNAAATGAEAVVTGCPGCVMHLADGLNRNQVPARALHLAEVLEMAYQKEK